MTHCPETSPKSVTVTSYCTGQSLRRHPALLVQKELDKRVATLDRHHQSSDWEELRQHQTEETLLLGQIRSGQYQRHSLADRLIRACHTWESDCRWAADTLELAARVALWGRQHDPNDHVVAEYAARRAASDALMPYVGEAVGTPATGQYRNGRGVVIGDGRTFHDPTGVEVLTPTECSSIADGLAALDRLNLEHPTPVDESEFKHHSYALNFTRPPVGALLAIAEVVHLDLLRCLHRSTTPRTLGIGCGPATCQLLSALVPVVVQGCNPHLDGQLEQADFDIVIVNVLDRHLLGEQSDIVNNEPLLPRPLPMSLPSRKSWEEYIEASTLYGQSKLAEGGLLAVMAAPAEGGFHVAEDVLAGVEGMEPHWVLHPRERRGVWFPQVNQHPLLERFGITQPKGRLLSFWRRA